MPRCLALHTSWTQCGCWVRLFVFRVQAARLNHPVVAPTTPVLVLALGLVLVLVLCRRLYHRQWRAVVAVRLVATLLLCSYRRRRHGRSRAWH